MRRKVETQPSLRDRARLALLDLMAADTATLENLSTQLGLSCRTLQRHLSREGTSFSCMIEDARRIQALAHIARGGTTLKVISRRLGYSQASTLTRAVRRWTGAPPSRIRARGRGETDG